MRFQLVQSDMVNIYVKLNSLIKIILQTLSPSSDFSSLFSVVICLYKCYENFIIRKENEKGENRWYFLSASL
jgi:hypothetical protein